MGEKQAFELQMLDLRFTPGNGHYWLDQSCSLGAKTRRFKFSLKIPKADDRLARRTSTIGTGCCSAQPV